MGKPRPSDIWRHNGRLGTVTMFQVGCDDILRSSICTEESKELIRQIQPLVEALRLSLKKRTDQVKEVPDA